MAGSVNKVILVGNLGRDPAWIDARRPDLVEQPAVKTLAADVRRQQIDRHAKVPERSFPRGREAQRLALHQPRQALVETPRRCTREQKLRVGGDRRARKRFRPNHASRRGFNQWLEQDIDLLVADCTLEQQVTPWGGG